MKNKKIGLALGGGAVLGAAHIGVLKALEELEISVQYVAGTSIGAFVAVFYAFDKTWKEIEEIALKLKWMDISGISLSQYGLLKCTFWEFHTASFLKTPFHLYPRYPVRHEG